MCIKLNKLCSKCNFYIKKALNFSNPTFYITSDLFTLQLKQIILTYQKVSVYKNAGTV